MEQEKPIQESIHFPNAAKAWVAQEAGAIALVLAADIDTQIQGLHAPPEVMLVSAIALAFTGAATWLGSKEIRQRFGIGLPEPLAKVIPFRKPRS